MPEDPPPLPVPPQVPPAHERTPWSAWRAAVAASSPFPDVDEDPYSAQLAFLFGIIIAGAIAVCGAYFAAAGYYAWLAAPLAVAVAGGVLRRTWQRADTPKRQAVLKYTGRALLWTTIFVGIPVYVVLYAFAMYLRHP